jgi:hypothetical protein
MSVDFYVRNAPTKTVAVQIGDDTYDENICLLPTANFSNLNVVRIFAMLSEQLDNDEGYVGEWSIERLPTIAERIEQALTPHKSLPYLDPADIKRLMHLHAVVSAGIWFNEPVLWS